MIRPQFAAAAACALLAACGPGKKSEPAAPAAPAGPAAPAAPAPPVHTGPQEATDGGVALTDTDEKLATGQFYDGYPLRVDPGKGTVITVTARGFTPVIVIIDSNRQKVSETEGATANADGSRTVQLSETYPAGDYYILVCASDVGAKGRYTIEAQSSTPVG
jgi:hypothetical protein